MPEQQTLEKHTIPYISASRLSTWLDCAKKYELSYIADLEEDTTSVPLAFGSSIHEAISEFFESLKAKNPIGVDEVHAVFERAFSGEVFVAESMNCPMDWKDTNYEEALEKGQKMLTCFVDKVDRELDVISTEYDFFVALDIGVSLKGYMDCLVRTGKNRYKIIEIKTAAKTYTKDRLLYDLQPTTYITALKEIFPDAEEIEFEYWLLMKTKEPDLKILPVARNAGDIAEFKETLQCFIAGIDTNSFPRRRGWMCNYCGYSKACRIETPEEE